ncbi:MAG: hypothetical protein A3E25_17965 [Burkholderiales bacterium RIFCSPHIGHO2_12_FULL_69_20]|nr:MAG: hypothetical protein A3E25_17965 [Burkholderiales bacterium RIFCSPHIGHO2_12_FULL_69_20]
MAVFDDSSQVQDGAVLDADLCIVGAGAAGITLAANLAATKLRVLLLEGGGERMSGESQGLYQAEQTGLDYFDLTACRLRYFGGTTNHWGGYCRENDPIDYERRPDVGLPGWPLTHADVAPYVDRAAVQLGLDPEGFSPKPHFARHSQAGDRLLEDLSDQFETKVFQLSKRLRFQELYADQLRDSSNTHVLLNANVVHLALNQAGTSVAHLQVRGAGGRRRFRGRAKRFVLAAHAIENARLLLLSDDVQRSGIGNGHDQVGRYFMEHPHVVNGLFFPSPRFPAIYGMDRLQRVGLNANLGLSRSSMTRQRILQYYCRFVPVYDFDRSADAVKRVADGFWEPMDLRMLKALSRVTQRPLEALRFGAYRAGVLQPRPVAYSLDHRIEQAPSPESRITLSDAKDALGLRRARLHWQLNDIDYRTFDVGQQTVMAELSRLGMGQFKAARLGREAVDAGVFGHYHHIGTTRMGTSPTGSVVDTNCRVHGVDNLFMAGSSVFASSGYSGPTMMLIAFAIRLAEHLVKLSQTRA